LFTLLASRNKCWCWKKFIPLWLHPKLSFVLVQHSNSFQLATMVQEPILINTVGPTQFLSLAKLFHIISLNYLQFFHHSRDMNFISTIWYITYIIITWRQLYNIWYIKWMHDGPRFCAIPTHLGSMREAMCGWFSITS